MTAAHTAQSFRELSFRFQSIFVICILSFSGFAPGQNLAYFNPRQQQGLHAASPQRVLNERIRHRALYAEITVMDTMNARAKRPITSRIRFDVFIRRSPCEMLPDLQSGGWRL